MAKFALLLLALVAVQGCYGASLGSPKLNDLEEVVAEFASAMKDLKEIISFIAGHLSSVARDYEYQISEIVEDRPVFLVIAELRSTLYKLEAESGEESKNCFSTAWTSTAVATEEMKRGLDSCISAAHAAGGHIKSVLETVDGKASHLEAKLVAEYHKCMEEGKVGTEAVQCLRDVIEPLKVELASLQKEVDDAHDHIHKDVEDATRNLNICLQRLREDTSLKSEHILGSVNQCIQGDHASFTKSSPRGILDFFRELKEKIDYIIHIMSHLPSSISDIPDKINEIISHINISVIYSQLKNEVHDIIEEGGRDAEKCRADADEKLDALIKNAEDSSQVCMAATEGKVEEVEAELEGLIDEAKDLLSDVNKEILDCISINPIEFAKCLEKQVDDLKDRIDVLQKKVANTIEMAKQQAKELLETLARCANKVQLDTINNGQALIADVEKCVRNSRLLF